MAGRPWRVLRHAPAEGAWNMAVDEALAEAAGAGESPPTLRLYAWQHPTVSLGYLQRAADVLSACEAAGVPVVRRPTGGRAVLHHRELTYSLALPLDPPWDRLSVGSRFRRLSAALLAGLARLGVDAALGEVPAGPASAVPSACFAVRGMPAVLVAGRKLLGSAERSWERALLQHGSLLLGFDAALHRRVFPRWTGAEREVVTLAQVLPALPEPDVLAQALVEGCEQALGVHCEPGSLTAGESARATALCRDRYAQGAFTRRR